MFFKRLSTLITAYLCLLILPAPIFAASLSQDQSAAVILAYHRIGEDAHPASNLRIEQFITHIEEIERENYLVLPLPDILNALHKSEPLPENTLGITFEGAYSSAYQNAMPLLIEKNIPFTVIYASNTADQNIAAYMDWEDLKALSKSPLVTLAALPAPYDYTVYQGEQAILKSLNKARQKYRDTFNREVDILSYPFGIYTPKFQTLAKQQGFKAALTLDSGAAHSGSNPLAIPRFTMTEDFGDIDRFRMVASSLPLPATELEPQTPLLSDTAFTAGFTMPDQLSSTPDCFLSGHGKPNIEKIGNRIEIRSAENIAETNRLRLNCTMIGKTDEDGAVRWRWLGKIFHRAPESPNPEPDALP